MMRPVSLLLATASLVACTAMRPAPADAALVNPFGGSSASAAHLRAIAVPAACPPVPPVQGLSGVRYYTNAGSTDIDQDRREQNRAASRPINNLASQVANQTQLFLASHGANTAAAACAVAILDGWARANALAGPFNEQALGQRRWVINSVAVDFLALKDAAPIDPEARARVTRWLNRQGNAIIATIGALTNNHLYWAAAAVAATAIASGDQTQFDWAIGAARQGLSEVDEAGALPKELNRGPLAMHYQVFALEPLVQVAGFAKANGIDLYSVNNGALKRLATLTVRNLDDPSGVGRLAGASQQFEGDNADTRSWAEQYYADTGDCAVAPLLSRGRPVHKGYLGGDTTLLYGARRSLSACGA